MFAKVGKKYKAAIEEQTPEALTTEVKVEAEIASKLLKCKRLLVWLSVE